MTNVFLFLLWGLTSNAWIREKREVNRRHVSAGETSSSGVMTVLEEEEDIEDQRGVIEMKEVGRKVVSHQQPPTTCCSYFLL